MNEKTELEKRDMQRLSNEEANKITKECILSALIILMSEKPFDKITITELVKRSGVSRTAFYRNFSSKEEVLSDLSQSILGCITKLIIKAVREENPHHMYCQIFQIIKDNHQDFDVMLKAGLLQNEYMNASTYIDNQFSDFGIMARYAV